MRASPFAAGGERGVVRCRQSPVAGDMQIFMVGFSYRPKTTLGYTLQWLEETRVCVPWTAPGR